MCMERDKFIAQNRRRLRCALPGFAESEWHNTTPHLGKHMGRLPILNPTKDDLGTNLQAPPELHDEGCPGAWYRCQFARSVLRYRRMLTDSGFSANILLDRCEDPLVIEAVQYLERETLACRSADMEKRNAR